MITIDDYKHGFPKNITIGKCLKLNPFMPTIDDI